MAIPLLVSTCSNIRLLRKRQTAMSFLVVIPVIRPGDRLTPEQGTSAVSLQLKRRPKPSRHCDATVVSMCAVGKAAACFDERPKRTRRAIRALRWRSRKSSKSA